MFRLEDGNNGGELGFVYDEDEVQASLFALDIFATRLDKNLFPGDSVDAFSFEQGKQMIGELRQELSDDLQTILPISHTMLTQLFLPNIVNLHDALTPDTYAQGCEILEVKPFDLFWNATTARQMLEQDPKPLQLGKLF